MAGGEWRQAWTRQSTQMWEELKTSGRYLAREEFVRAKNGDIADYYLDFYRWLTYRAASYVRLPEDAEMPIWLALTEAGRLGETDGTVQLRLEVPEEELLVLDSDKWGYCLNDWYVPHDADDERAFSDELALLGITNEALLVLTDKGNYYPHLRSKIIASRERVLSDGPSLDPDKNIGVVWEIRREWVQEVS